MSQFQGSLGPFQDLGPERDPARQNPHLDAWTGTNCAKCAGPHSQAEYQERTRGKRRLAYLMLAIAGLFLVAWAVTP